MSVFYCFNLRIKAILACTKQLMVTVVSEVLGVTLLSFSTVIKLAMQEQHNCVKLNSVENIQGLRFSSGLSVPA